ncbi:hypothetical protein K523DRAFT_365652 [Schizophyllum commune Tattone D]|nr:hypothetical protein K523DRAFT_365652 [Schizophyllum commune Tattone D]
MPDAPDNFDGGVEPAIPPKPKNPITPTSQSDEKTGNPYPYDYETKYPKDEEGEELTANARIWRVLLDEGKTGLFSAVVTTLVVQSSQALQPDATEKNMAILSHVLLFIQPYGSAMHTAPFSIVTDTLRPSSMDYWGNRFWFISLALSLFAAFMAVLIRQWVHEYERAVAGHAKHRVLVGQYRYSGMKRWRVPFIVALLPMMLHLALLFFFVGLILFVFKLDRSMAWALAAFTIFFYSLYLLTTILPMIFVDCPYQTPVSYYVHFLVVRIWGWIWWSLQAVSIIHNPQNPTPRTDLVSWTPRSREKEAVQGHKDELVAKSLARALSTSSNPTLIRIAARAIFGLFRAPDTANTPTSDRVVDGIAKRLRHMLKSRDMRSLEWKRGQEDEFQHFVCSLLLFADDKDKDDDAYRRYLSHVIDSLPKEGSPTAGSEALVDAHQPALEAAVFALSDPLVEPPAPLRALFPFLFPNLGTTAPVSGSDELTYWAKSSLAGPLSPTGLKLDSLIWSHMVGYFAYASYFSSRQCLHLALFFWRNMDPTAPIRSGNKRQVRKEAVTLQWMCTTAGQGGFRKDVQRAIHRLLMCSEESCDAYKILTSKDSNKGTGKEKHDTVDHDSDEDEAVWLHMSDRAISAYALLAKDARLMSSTQANQNEIKLKESDQANIGFLAATFAHFLRPHYSLEFISTADKFAGLPGVHLDTHAKLASRFRQAVNLLADGELQRDDVKALFKFLVRLLKVCPITEHRAHNVHIDTVRTLGRLLDLSSSDVYDAIIENRINPFDILRPLADASVSNPSSGPLSQALASMLVSYVDNAVESLRHSIHMSSLQLVGTTRDVEQSEFLVWCVWIDVLSTTQTGQSTTSASQQQGGTQAQQASGPPPAPSIALQPSQSSDAQPGQQITGSALHQALKTLIGLITPQSRAEWLYRLERALEEPLPLAVGMALNEWRGHKAFGELLHAMSDVHDPLFSRTVAVERLLTTARVRVQVRNDGKITNPKQDCLVDTEQAYPHGTTTLPLSGLLSLQEYRRKMDAASPRESIAERRADVVSMDTTTSSHRSRNFYHVLTDYLNKLLGALSPNRKTNRGAVKGTTNGMASQA